MKVSLDMKLGQRLTMTPQLQQAIKLLQMSSLDLMSEIQQVLESNPMLDEVDPAMNDADFEPSGVDAENTDVRDEPSTDGLTEEFSGDVVRTDDSLNGEDYSSDNGLDTDIEAQFDPPVAPSAGPNNGDDNWDSDARRTAPASLTDHLMSQVGTIHFSALDRHIANTIVMAVDDSGYLNTGIDDIAAMINEDLGLKEAEDEFQIDVETVAVVLRQIQNLDPVGVGARNLTECLLIQLHKLPLETGDTDLHKATAAKIIENHLESLAGRDYAAVKKALKSTTRV